MLRRQQSRRVRKERPHILRDFTHPDGRKVIDGKPRILGIVHRKQPRECRSKIRDAEPLDDFGVAHLLNHFRHHDLDKDTRGRGRFVLVHMDDVEDRPGDSVRCDQVAEEPTDITELVGFVSMDGLVVLCESFLEGFCPDPVELAEAFTDETVKVGVGAFL